MKLSKDTIAKLYAHALEDYPYECCGIVTGTDIEQNVRKCENIQNRLHTEDPVNHPRDARTAYSIERNEFDRIITLAKNQDEKIIAFYHSHPEHEAYFSEEDLAAQTVFGEPEFPDALQVVVSVMDRKIHDLQCYIWDRELQNFTAIEDCA